MSSEITSIQSQFNLNTGNSNPERVYEFEKFRLNAALLMLYEDGEPIALAPKVVETLLALVERAGEIVSKKEMMNRLWADSFVEDANLTQNIYLLRKTLGKSADGRDLIETFRRRGYRFTGEIRRLETKSEALSSEAAAEARAAFSPDEDSSVRFDSLAVLPLTNQSGDANAEYLSDGVTESIINRLSQISRLRVVARNTVFQYKNREVVPQEVGRALGVSAVLTGRVLQHNDRLIVRAELVDAMNGWQIWGEQYDRPAADVLEIQETIAREISENLRLKLTGDERKRLTMRYTQSSSAYHLYIKGRFYLNKRLTETIEQAADFFQQAIDLDPTFAPAYVGLADCYPLLSLYGALTPHEAYPKAKAAAEKALEIDDGYTKAYTSLGVVKLFYEWDWTGAEIAFRRAIELNPGYPDAHQRYGMFLTAVGRFDEAVAEFKSARELDPLSLIIKTIGGYAFYYSRRYDLAEDCFREVTALSEDYSMAHFRLGLTQAAAGKYEEAIKEIEKAVELSNDRDSIAALGYVAGLAGNRATAEDALSELDEREKSGFVTSYNRALVHIGLGNYETAVDWLEKAYKERSYWLIYLKHDPSLDALRHDARFRALEEKIFGADTIRTPQTSDFLNDVTAAHENEAGRRRRWLIGVGIAVLLLAAFALAKIYWRAKGESPLAPSPLTQETADRSAQAAPASVQPKLYLQMSEVEQVRFIKEKTREIQKLIEDEPTEISDEAARAVKIEIDDYVQETYSLSPEHFEDGLRVIYGRASQFVPVVGEAYKARQLPPAIGIYQAMIESEYLNCPSPGDGRAHGIFQFSPKTAAKYGLLPKDFCDVEKQSDAAAHYLSDLLRDFDNHKLLAIYGYNLGEKTVERELRQLREKGIGEKNFWKIFQNKYAPGKEQPDDSISYVLKFIAAAVIGENPSVFNLATPPLSTLTGKSR